MKRILIIDDEESLRATIGMILESAGYETLKAGSGATGLVLAREHLPDLTLCDVNMPGMDGTEVLKAFRADPDLASLPFVMVTGNPGQTPQRVGMSLGADDYLTKPFEIDELLQRVAARLDRAEIHWRVEGRTLRELRTNLHSILPHEFFTPLVGIIGLAEVLKEDADHLSPAQIVEYAADIERSGQRLHRTLRNYLKILDLDQGATEAQPAGPGDRPTGAEALSLVSRTARSVAARHNRTADLVLRIQPGTQPRIDRESLNVLTEELVENACSYSRHGSPIQVELAAEKGGTVLRVSDKGRGMTAEQVKRIGAFRQFDRKRYEQQGLGLGLSLAGRLIQRAGATLEVQSATGEGTTVTVGLPDGR